MSEENKKTDEIEVVDAIDNKVVTISKKKVLIREIIMSAVAIAVISLISLIFLNLKIDTNADINILDQYQFSSSIMIHSTWVGALLIGIFLLAIFLLKPSLYKPKFSKKRYIAFFIIFELLGIFAYIVLNQILAADSFKIALNVTGSAYISSLIVLTYSYLIYKLFCEDFISNKGIFWEIFRFALVGLIAAIFDYLVTSLTRLSFGDNKGQIYATIVAVTCGFIVGVIINYILSVTMVYKSTTNNFAKTKKGIVLFVILSAVGLLIGIGFESIFYNEKIIFLEPYILVFLLRTIIVMVFNYLTRKFILFK